MNPPRTVAHESTTVRSRKTGFEPRYEQTANAVRGKFTLGDLAKLLERLADKPDDKAAA